MLFIHYTDLGALDILNVVFFFFSSKSSFSVLAVCLDCSLQNNYSIKCIHNNGKNIFTFDLELQNLQHQKTRQYHY